MTVPRETDPGKSTPLDQEPFDHGPHGRDTHGLRVGLRGLRDLMDRLLAKDGCPWDQEQTLATLEPYLIEEAYEVLDAIDDPVKHQEELGDLLFQIVFQAALREREDEFDFDDVIAGIRAKMIRRHPHVFERVPETGLTAQEVTQGWQRIKAQERAAKPNADPGPEDPLAGVPEGLPALARARQIQDKAAAVGFDWPDIAGPMAKVEEEWAELRAAIGAEQQHGDGDGAADPAALQAAVQEEFGDLLFVLVRLAQKIKVDPERALRETIRKFEGRFAHVMRRCRESDIEPGSATLEQLDVFWDEAKD